ncbi:MAG: class I SAM-dependent methyltransferase [Patescibacteria group bacterium]|nr:class I SAM-dependent methyltransferase [Patescibacteria group bacterium]MCL5093704.1 class I SAM-dependent methyltransferase [Patescibacteria group bacterium]
MTVYTHFAKTVGDYDTVADKVVFKNDELHQLLIEAMPTKKEKKLQILDLGSGTGHGMKLALEKYPNSAVTGIDFSPKMIEKARQNLSKYTERIKLLKKDFNFYDFSDQKYHVILSAIAIHNSTDIQKEKLYKKIYDSLPKGGYFINGDFFKTDSKLIDKRLLELYCNYLKSNLKGKELEC